MERDYTQSRTNPFPVHVFPDRLQRIILELHDSNGFPADYTAASMMAAISVAIGNSHRVEVKRMGHKTKRVKWNGSVYGESLLISAR